MAASLIEENRLKGFLCRIIMYVYMYVCMYVLLHLMSLFNPGTSGPDLTNTTIKQTISGKMKKK
jgi:amino acid permease